MKIMSTSNLNLINAIHSAQYLAQAEMILNDTLFGYEGEDPYTKKSANGSPVATYGNIVIGNIRNGGVNTKADAVQTVYTDTSLNITIEYNPLNQVFGIRPAIHTSTLVHGTHYIQNLIRLNFINDALVGMRSLFRDISVICPVSDSTVVAFGDIVRSTLLSYFRENKQDLNSVDHCSDSESIEIPMPMDWSIEVVSHDGDRTNSVPRATCNDLRTKKFTVNHGVAHIKNQDITDYATQLGDEDGKVFVAAMAITAFVYDIKMESLTLESVKSLFTLVTNN